MSAYRFFSGFLGYLFRTNIYGGGTGGAYFPYAPPQRSIKLGAAGTSYPGLLYNQQTIEQYLAILDMLSEMYMFSIAGVTTRHVSDVILETIKEDISINIECEDERFIRKATDFLKDYFKNANIHSIIMKIIPDIVYYGSYSFYIGDEYELINLYDPHCIITVRGDNYKEVGYILNTLDGMMYVSVNNSKIFKIGSDELLLYSNVLDINERIIKDMEDDMDESSRYSKRVVNYYSSKKNLYRSMGYYDDNTNKNPFIRKYIFSAAQPLFYYTRMQLREYILKQVIIGLTTLRDILFPLVYTLQYEYPAVAFTVENLADRVEDILNEYVDISGFVGVKGNLTQVLNMITYSIRVLPDFRGSIANLTPLDTTKLTEKIDKYKGDLAELSSQILEELGVPSNERITYWEGLRQSERFATKINSINNSINDSLSQLGYYLLTKQFPGMANKIHSVKISLFDVSYGKMARMQNAVENISNFISSSFEMLENISERVTGDSAKYYNEEEIVEFIKSNLRHVFPNVDNIINWEKVKKDISQAAKESSSDEMDDYSTDFYKESGGIETSGEEEIEETGEEGGEEGEGGGEEDEEGGGGLGLLK